ncbi:DNA binding protein [Bacillus phage YungSlug]|nr:DNA binding protein [Bacillus phage YungSlug]
MELKYVVIHKESGEGREWEGEPKKAHRTFRKVVREDLKATKVLDLEITITGDDKEVEVEYMAKAINYLEKLVGEKIAKSKKPKQPKGTGLTLKSTPENPIFDNIMKAVKKGELTELEGLVMNWMLKEGFYAETHFSDIVVGDIAVGLDLPVNTIKGVIGSLTKKEYAYTQTNECYDIVYATSKGYQLDDEYDTKWKDGDY